MTQKQPEALRLAEIMDDMPFGFTAVSAELRRLHDGNAELLAEHEMEILDLNLLRKAVEANDPKAELLIRIDDILRRKKAAIAKAEGEQA